MISYLFSFGILIVLLLFPLFFPAGRKKSRKIKIPKNHNDTSGANYAVNEHGFLERIHHDKLTGHSG